MTRPPEMPSGAGTEAAADWNDKFRPQRFSEVIGQERAIRSLKAQLASGSLAHIILAGMSGVGKTTLARIIAGVGFCRAPADGEPCGGCRDCLIFGRGARHPMFFELSAPSLGNKEELRAFVEDTLAYVLPGYGHYIVFLDEAHRLTVHAQDLLLKLLEDSNRRIIFIFALIASSDLPDPFRSRCRPIELEAPTIEDRIAGLERIVAGERLDVEPEALQLIAGQSTGHRDATRDLQRGHEAADGGNPITIELVKRTLYYERSGAVVSLVAAALAGDMTAALAANGRMTDDPHSRVRDVRRLLTYLKTTRVGPHLAPAAPADQLLYDGVELAALVAALHRNANQLGVSLPAYFAGLLDHWLHLPSLTRETFELHVIEFVDLCARLHVPGEGSPFEQLAALPSMDEPYRAPTRWRAPAVRRHARLRDAAAERQFLTADQARAIYEASTFLVQAHGVTFNTALPIAFVPLAIHSEREAAKLLTAVGRELAQSFMRWAGGVARDEPLHRLSHLTRDQNGDLRALLLFHCPVRFEANIRRWLDTWFARFTAKRGISADAPVPDCMRPADSRDAVDAHWRLVRRILAGVDPKLEAGQLPLIERLQVSKRLRAPAGCIAGNRSHTSETISPVARRGALRNGMEHVSAWGAGRWDQLFTGWEMREHHERQALRAEREQFAADLARRRSATGDRLSHLRLDQLAAEEQQRLDVAPEARPRTRPLWPDLDHDANQ